MKNKPKNIPSPYKFAGTKIFRDTTALPFLSGGPLVDKTNHGKLLNSIYASALGNYYANGGQFLTAGGEYHKIYKNANGDIIVNHPKENKGKWDTINLTDKANAKTIADGIAATKKWHAENPNVYKNGGLIKRADGSYSQRGLWDNIRANKGSGKKPTKEMLAQERKINAKNYANGGALDPLTSCGPNEVWDEELQACRPIKPAFIQVEDEKDPRYQEFLERQRLYEFSQIPNFNVRDSLINTLNRNYSNAAKYPFVAKEALKKNEEYYKKYPKEYTKELQDELYGPYGSKVNLKNLTPEEFEIWKNSINPNYLEDKSHLEKLLTKYPPNKYIVKEGLDTRPYNYYINQDQKGRWEAPETAFLEDKINRQKLKESYPDLTDKQIDDWILENRTTPSYISNVYDDRTNEGWIDSPGSNVTTVTEDGSSTDWVPTKYPNFNPPSSYVDPNTGIRGYYPDYMSESIRPYYEVLPYWDKPEEIRVKIKSLPPLPVKEIDQSIKGKLQGIPTEEDVIPEYSVPYYKKTGPVLSLEEGKTRSYKGLGVKTNGRRINRTKYYNLPQLALYKNVVKDRLIPSVIQKLTGYDPKYMEGYTDEEGNYIPGEIEQAQQEGRRIEFKGISSRKDKKAQEEYNRAYDAYTAKKGYQDMLIKMAEKGVLPFGGNSYRTGGQFPRPYSLPEDSFKQGGTNLHNSIYASSNAQYPAVYRNGGMTSKFYASNVPDNNISNKDLTYPKNSYVYTQGGDLNNLPMNRYPAASKFLQKGSTASPLTNMMSLPAKTVAYEKGGKIYIKPENRGKFTASANRAGMGVQEFASHVLANKEDYSSTQVKRANFARNAAGWKHAHGGHMMAAGGWPPGLKLKNPSLQVMPYYTNALTGLIAPSAEIGLNTKIGKQKGGMGWSIEPHIGVGYESQGKFPISGGLDARYKGLPSPNRRGYATVDMGVGYNPGQGFGAGLAGGYNYRLFGQSNKRLGEIPAGKASLDLMPYAGWQLSQRPKEAMDIDLQGGQGYTGVVSNSGNSLKPAQKGKNISFFNSPVYGLKAEAQWRPKLFPHASGSKAPITFFGRGDINLNPVRGQQEQKAQYGVTSSGSVNQYTGEGETGYNYEQQSGLKFTPQISGVLGARMPISRLKEYMPERKRIPAVEGGEYYEETPTPGDFTFAQRTPTIDSKGNAIRGEYEEEIGDFNRRMKPWGTNIINPNFGTDFEARRELGEMPFQQIDYNEPIIEEDEDYKYGGAMNFKYGGFNNPGFNALPKNVQAKIKARAFDNGGVMPQLTEFNEGGRHEENVLGGIPQGTAPDGRLNLVEEGETKLNAANYIFSDSLKLDAGIAAAFNLPKKDVGKTFAEISKKLNRPNSRRDNDTIEQNAISRDLENLMLAQEAFKQIDLQKDIEMMKTKHPELMEAMDAAMQQQSAQQQGPVSEEMAQAQGAPQGVPQPGSPEEQAMMEQQMMAQQQGQEGMSPEQMAQIPMSYGGSMFMRGGKMCYDNGGRMYPGGGTMQNAYTVSGNMPAYDNRQFMSPVGMQNEPMFGSQEEAAAYMQNPANEAAIAQWKNPETGMGGQVQSNFYLNPDQPGTMVYPGASSTKQMKRDLSIANAPQFSFMPTAGAPMATGFKAGGHMYSKGGNVMRSIGAGAYGVGEGLLDTLTFGLTDQITDKGYDALASIGNRDAEDLERDRMIRGFGNTAGAIGGAVVSGGAATGSAISEGSEGLGAGLSNIKGTNANFDKTINSLAQIGSMAGSFAGGGPSGASGLGGASGATGAVQGATQGASQVPQFAQTLMQAGQNPFLKQVTGMAGSMMQRNGGRMYPSMYKYGGSFEMPRQQMYMPLDNVERAGGYLFDGGGDLGKFGDPLKGVDPNMLVQGANYATDYLYNPQAAINMGYDPKIVAEWTDPNTGEYEVPPSYRLEGPMKNFVSGLANNPNMMEAAAISAQNSFRGGEPLERMSYLPAGTISRNTPSFRGMGSNFTSPTEDAEIIEETDVVVNPNKRVNINGKLYTKDEALEAARRNEIVAEPEEINQYFAESIGADGEVELDETTIKTKDEEDLENIIYPGASNPNIITGGKGNYSDLDALNEEILAAQNMVNNAKNPKDKQKAQEYLSALKRMKTELENKNVDLTMKQTPLQAAALAAPIAYNLGMGLFSKPMQLKAEDYLNKSRITPYKVNVDPQLNETRLAYNAAEQGIRNAAPSAGAYLTNRANIAKMRASSLGEILAKKENADAQLQLQADIQNAQLEAQNRGTKFAIDDWNAKSKEAKRKYLEKAIEQGAKLGENAMAMDAQEKYMRLLSPQYGKTFEYQTIFDQLKDYYKNKKSSKENKA